MIGFPGLVSDWGIEGFGEGGSITRGAELLVDFW